MTTQEVPAVRERVHTWGDPLATAAAGRDVDGLSFLQRMAAGEVAPPPIATTLGFDVREVEHGRVVFAMEPAEFHFNPIGSVHGGVLATLLDSAMGCAVHSALPAGARYTSLDISVRFLRAVGTGSGPVRCEGVLVHLGGRTATAEARLTDGAGRLCATATTTCMIFRPGR
ncbi:PaaI family thioesterase [Pseudonocardia sp. MH-G8]|uniref:PaaI family thioesterase n=1 Tax=Pseudonocardia sp. MH-G8 TaxID=1854588 RepID=UPI0013045FB6|nr:PaaI family thioesterase [Pseudonocardia sp. MH-G8]